MAIGGVAVRARVEVRVWPGVGESGMVGLTAVRVGEVDTLAIGPGDSEGVMSAVIAGVAVS